MHNKYSLQAAYLAHMTPEEKKEYNKRYYQEHKEEYWGVKGDSKPGSKSLNGVEYFTNTRQRPHTITYDVKGGGSGRATLNSDEYRDFQDSTRYIREKLGIDPYSNYFQDGSGMMKLRGSKKHERQLTSDLNQRTAAVQRAQQPTNRLATPGLNQRLANMKAYAQPLRKTNLSSIASSAVSKGKSIVNGLTSLWKLGWK